MRQRQRILELAIMLVSGSVLGFLPMALLGMAPSDSATINALQWGPTFIMLPGFVVGMITARGRIDDISLWVAGSADFIFYSLLSYLVIKAWKKRRTRAGGPHMTR